jgi:uncharacterized membrane protein YecN with MAPEG domain
MPNQHLAHKGGWQRAYAMRKKKMAKTTSNTRPIFCIYMCAIDMCGGKAEFIHFAPRVLTASRRRSGSGFNQQPKCYIFSFSLELARRLRL